MTLEQVIEEVFNDETLRDPEDHKRKLAERIRCEFCVSQHDWIYDNTICARCGAEKQEEK